ERVLAEGPREQVVRRCSGRGAGGSRKQLPPGDRWRPALQRHRFLTPHRTLLITPSSLPLTHGTTVGGKERKTERERTRDGDDGMRAGRKQIKYTSVACVHCRGGGNRTLVCVCVCVCVR